ncbi:hypothetical protein [Pseudoclavibacter albus]|nr:hypothetical protein [Pseudoclavibacter alba]
MDLVQLELADDAVEEVSEQTVGMPSAVRYLVSRLEDSDIQ